MISAARATKILTEQDTEKRNAMIDALTEQDAKYILKQRIKVIRGEPGPQDEK